MEIPVKKRSVTRLVRSCAVAAVLAATGPVGAQHLFKCGAVYQDKPCADQDLQKRYAAGRFDVEQVNPDTDKDCARLVGEVMPYWTRMHKGESLEALKAEYDQKQVALAEKSAMRDLLIALKGVEGSPRQARSQLETQCMAYKRRRGIPTEREAEAARAGVMTRHAAPDSYSSSRQLAAQRRAEIAAERAARAAERAR